ncbi:citrate lyase subunit alpha [Brevirhabdus pacifica]|uniref:Citrate lyase alpha chain n=2 Tax=Brevirhabdus pacifica TaxID=1267768 RepID=A0A1U7DJK7_9RHOB|nr:citrate lyase subunit alpha [Brevirhabdus pacifica]APX90073.1 citrate lyase subunit alpha [Brevirhabdus pacifica]OWU75336.1 citrate lyase subunit alpha [Loktanella sp. 22II-4b]PJJ82674.1 citrate lyase subunit alpha/citrate CoA-transferase [Brevirhabdus pacifica]
MIGTGMEIPGYEPPAAARVPQPRLAPRAGRRGAALWRTDELEKALERAGLRDGMTVSFHHHLRNGDWVMNMVLGAAARMGIRDLHLAASSIFPVQAPLVPLVEDGTITRLTTNYLTGPLAEAVRQGRLAHPAVLQTHGGRARAIEDGSLPIDIAFIAAPGADAEGNLSGVHGPSSFGPMGYPAVDATQARQVVALTDSPFEGVFPRADIPGHLVDGIVTLPRLGDAARIVSGTTSPTTDPAALHLAQVAARAIAAAGLLRDGFSFQTGAGGISLAVAGELRRMMHEGGITGSFASGGITAHLVGMLEDGLLRELRDVQCFDLEAVASYACNVAHRGMSASDYASPARPDAAVNALDAMILGAAEIDLEFNVNVTTAGDGRIIGGSGGHADAAAGAKLTLVTTRLCAGDNPKIVARVGHVTTPGHTIDAVVTEAGIAVNPRRPELARAFRAAGLTVEPIEALARLAAETSGRAPAPPASGDPGPVVAVSEYRDGTLSDVIRRAG